MENDTLEHLFLGCLQVEDQFQRVVVCSVSEEGVMDLKTNKKYPWPHLSRRESEVIRGIVYYPRTEIKELVSLSMLQKYLGKKLNRKNRVEMIDDLVNIYDEMMHPKGKQKIKKIV